MIAQFLERETCGVLALAAVRAIEIRIVDVREGCGLELGVFHGLTVARVGCGVLLCKSYSLKEPGGYCISRRRFAARLRQESLTGSDGTK